RRSTGERAGDGSAGHPARCDSCCRDSRCREEEHMSFETVLADYQAKTTRSRALFEEAQRVLPGGNTRTTVFVDPYPFYAARGAGSRIWDVDGTERLDFNSNYTSLILGHAPADVVAAVRE